MRLGILIVFAVFAAVLAFGEPTPATAQSCAGCSGVSAFAGRPVRGVFKRLSAVRPLQRIRAARGCGG